MWAPQWKRHQEAFSTEPHTIAWRTPRSPPGTAPLTTCSIWSQTSSCLVAAVLKFSYRELTRIDACQVCSVDIICVTLKLFKLELMLEINNNILSIYFFQSDLKHLNLLKECTSLPRALAMYISGLCSCVRVRSWGLYYLQNRRGMLFIVLHLRPRD